MMRMMLLLAALLAAMLTAAGAAPAPKRFSATVVKVVDGDTIKVKVPAFAAVPLATWSLRIAGIDTPESHLPPAKCAREVERGRNAAAFARMLLKPGDRVSFAFLGPDKYFRIDAAVRLAGGGDFGAMMIAAGHAARYDGGKKRDWCTP